MLLTHSWHTIIFLRITENFPNFVLRGYGHASRCQNVLYNDLEDSEAQKLIRLLRRYSLKAFDTKMPPAAWTEPEFSGK